jgi:tetraacyldisaccharide 4'-kinase
VRWGLLPLTPLYAAAVAAKNAAYDRGWRASQRLKWPVISVGNVSVGGSGKTPFVIALAKLLKQQGIHVHVLSRGYGRSSNAVERVDPLGNAERYGDEPLLIAQSADIPVYVSVSRYEAGKLAESEHSGAGIHLLDDGFQHRRLGRAVDIGLVHRSDFEEVLLPAGGLREPVSSLKRASVLVLREEDGDLVQKLKERGIQKPIWRIKRSIEVSAGQEKAIAFCGIARPEEFFEMLRRHGVNVILARSFCDHHRYSDEDVRQLVQLGREYALGMFLTTEKDLVRLLPAQKKSLDSAAPLRVVKLTVEFCNEAAVLRDLRALLPSGFDQML